MLLWYIMIISDGYIPMLIMFHKLPMGGRWNPLVPRKIPNHPAMISRLCLVNPHRKKYMCWFFIPIIPNLHDIIVIVVKSHIIRWIIPWSFGIVLSLASHDASMPHDFFGRNHHRGFLSGGGSESPQDYVGLTHNNLQIDNVPWRVRWICWEASRVIPDGWEILDQWGFWMGRSSN